MDELTSEDYKKMGPGIRNVVRWLRQNDFDTAAEDDGTGHDPDCTCAVPYVAIVTDPDMMIDETHRLLDLLTARDPSVFEVGLTVHAMYDPLEETAIIDLTGPALVSSWGLRAVS